ncbi:MAG: class I SAM-dependent methyltransferase [Ilumatobacter sp.]|nr:class I SAM-dependent methyltransferase [Ilumatobacter sp.]
MGTPFDNDRATAFLDEMRIILNHGMAATMIGIGHRVGLFDTMARLDGRCASSTEVADLAGLHERYVREWLDAMTVARIVEYDPKTDGYRLPPEHAAFTTRAAGMANMASYAQYISLCAAVEDELVECFQHGGGVPYESFDRFHAVMAESSGQRFDALLVGTILPLVPGVVELLEHGVAVADVGCGRGHAVNLMARAFPRSTFLGIDFSDTALDVGRAEAAEWGLSNATFLAADAADLGDDHRYDFITTFDAVHDQAHPKRMVDGIFRSLAPGGHWLCADIRASSHVGENLDHPMGSFMYGVSCQHCMTVSLAYDGEGLGAMWGVHRAKELFAESGFTDIAVHSLPYDPSNNYYVCRKP